MHAYTHKHILEQNKWLVGSLVTVLGIIMISGSTETL
jgi:hypothetical protein